MRRAKEIVQIQTVAEMTIVSLEDSIISDMMTAPANLLWGFRARVVDVPSSAGEIVVVLSILFPSLSK